MEKNTPNEEDNVSYVFIEQLLKDARLERGWTYWQVAEHLNDLNLTDKTIKKWESGLLYPDLNMIYKLSELYGISSDLLVQAKNNSLQYGYSNVHSKLIKFICSALNIPVYGAVIFSYIFYAFLFVVALACMVYFANACIL